MALPVAEEGGIKSVGAGFVASISIGWQNSLLKALKNSITRTTTAIGNLEPTPEIAVEGFVSLLTGSHVTQLEMEGGKWSPILITDVKVDALPVIEDAQKSSHPEIGSAWAIGYIRDDCCMLPKGLWENLSKPIRIYGEMIPSKVSTAFGNANGFLKVRIVAHIEPTA